MDASPIIQLIIVIILLVLSSFFSSAETALTTVNKHKLRARADEGSRRAAKVLKITENPGKLLSTILIGNNIVNIAASALTTTLCTAVFGSHMIGVATGVLTLLVLIFGEITPKTLATLYAVEWSMIIVYPIAGLMVVLTPVIWLLNIITGVLFKIFRIDPNANANAMTESELLTIVNVSEEEGVIEQEERVMISNVVDFGDALSKEVMIPRADVVFADVNSTYAELVELFMKETYSRIPIYEDSKDHVIGILYLKDLFFYSQVNDMEYFDIRSILRKPIFVYEYQKTSKIFAEMKTSSVSVAIVLDEYGVTSGIITMEDLIEEIVGEIRDEYDENENDFVRRIDDNMYDIDGSIRLDDLNDVLGTSLASEDYDSLAGFVIQIMDKLPEEGEETDFDNIHFKVGAVNKNRIERVLLTITPPAEDVSEDTADGEIDQ
ncbi:MAG: hemolysin family protein [Eubacteriales bacterium]|nr:hemolysin family protein [Lachnospiraceae bacterium]MDO5126258.1 hemolysin family protein [Eubacteriales bacterium]